MSVYDDFIAALKKLGAVLCPTCRDYVMLPHAHLAAAEDPLLAEDPFAEPEPAPPPARTRKKRSKS